jgi:hypothetical protein
MRRNHASKPAPRTSPIMDSRAPVCAHGNCKSVNTHPSSKRGRKGRRHPIDVARNFDDPEIRFPNGAPGSNAGAGPGSDGPPVTGGIGPGGPLGSY